MEDIYIGGKKPRRDNNKKQKQNQTDDIYVTPRNSSHDIYISNSRKSRPQLNREDYGIEPGGAFDFDDNDYDPEPPPEKNNKKPKKKHGFFRRIKALVLVAAIIFGIGTGLIYFTFSSVNYTETGHSKNVFLDSSSLMQSPMVQNILLIGVDRRNPDDSSRSDTMLLVSVNSATRKIKLTSFMRDSYVYIPEKKTNAKLNAACAWGGAQTVMDTIEYNFNIRIDHYMMVDFTMFEDIIDGLGGVNVAVTEKEAVYMRDIVHLQRVVSGESVHLNGNEALWYCRIRKLDSDFMRTGRQRKVMTALINKCKRTNPVELYKLMGDIVSRVETDMSPLSLTWLAVNGLIRYLHYDIEQGSVPADGTWKSKSINGQSVLSLDLNKNVKYLEEFIYEK